MLSRRDVLKTLAASAAVGVLDTGWPSAALAAAAPRGTHWTNKHLNLSTIVRTYHDVSNTLLPGEASASDVWRTGLTRLQSIVAEGGSAGSRIRAVGGRWSLSPVAICPDVMINTMPLNFHAVGLPPRYVASTAVEPEHLVFAQCGTSVMQLSATLEGCGLSLPTSGASNGQTICGAISTGTHGSAIRVGAMQDYMLGLHMIAEDGRHYWIEPASKPIVSDEFCQYLGATLIRNDQLFRAAVVGFGCFGIIHAVLFEAIPVYLLEVHRRRVDWPEAKRVAMTLDVDGFGLPYPGTEPFHVDVALNPYRPGAGQRGAVVTAMYKRPHQSVPKPGVKHSPLVPAVDLLAIAGQFADVLPASIPAGVNAMFDGMVKSRGVMALGTHGAIFPATTLIGRSLSSELGVDHPDTERAVETLIDVAREYPFPGMFGLRFVKQSTALLAFTRFETTCTIEMTGAGSRRTLGFYNRAWAALEARGIPFTQHWGKVNNTDRSNLCDRWGGAAAEWLAARRSFLGSAGRAMFSNDLLAACGLEA